MKKDKFEYGVPKFPRFIVSHEIYPNPCLYDTKNQITINPKLLKKYNSTIGYDLLTELEKDSIKAYKLWLEEYIVLLEMSP